MLSQIRRSIKAAKRTYKNKVEEHFNNNNPRSMWQGINNITGFKGSKPATVNIAASLPDELNTFYARFEADNTAHTESAAAAAAEEVSPLTLSVADVTRSFKRVNIRKAVGPDGIPGRVLKACAFQLASRTEQISVQLDPGLPDRQKSGGQNGQQHIIPPDPQHWCTAGLRPQPTPVLPVHTRLYSYTQLQCHRQIC